MECRLDPVQNRLDEQPIIRRVPPTWLRVPEKSLIRSHWSSRNA